MDANAVAAALGDRVGHCHGKDVAFSHDNLAINGLLDRRWPRPPQEMPWNFAVVGRGRDAAMVDGIRRARSPPTRGCRRSRSSTRTHS